MLQAGLVMRFAQLQPGKTIADSAWSPVDLLPGIEATYQLICDDDQEPRYASFYFVSDITPILSDDSLYSADVQKHSEDFASLAWTVTSFVNGRNPGEDGPFTGPQTPKFAPPKGTVIVANGSTPKPEWVSDYHSWYDQEHGGKLGKVPGWILMRRYKLEKLYGDVAVASFYGVNFYEEKNGLGGPEWKEGVTEWTLRVRDQAAKPNIRRVWKLEKVL